MTGSRIKKRGTILRKSVIIFKRIINFRRKDTVREWAVPSGNSLHTHMFEEGTVMIAYML